MHKKLGVIERDTRTFSSLYSIMEDSLSKAKSDELGSFDNSLIGMLFSAFCLEGYLNYIIEDRTENPKDLEWKHQDEKLTIVCKKIDYPLDKRKKPFSHYSTIFYYRDLIVHAKNFKTKHQMFVHDTSELLRRSKPEWQKMTNPKMCEMFVRSTFEMIDLLNEKAGYPTKPLTALETSSTHLIG